VTKAPAPQKGGDLFLELIEKSDRALHRKAEVLVDTNVVLEFMSFGDLLREGDKHRDIREVMSFRDTSEEELRRSAKAAWLSPEHRHRQLRARASITLMWVLAERRCVAAMLGKEVIDILEKISPVPRVLPTSLLADGTSYALTTAVVQAIHPMLISRGLHLGALTDVNHRARGNKADAELLRLAQRDSLPIISNEGYTVRGVSDFKTDGSKSLRGLARDRGVKVYTPSEYLSKLGVDPAREAKRFIHACERPMIEEYLRVTAHRSSVMWVISKIDHFLDRTIESTGYAAALEDVVPFYGLILLDERDEALEKLDPPAVR